MATTTSTNLVPGTIPTATRPRRAFTLIELLVTITIIGVLATLAFSALGRAGRAAKAAECLSNLRQIGAGITLYAGDNKGMFPYGIKQKGTIRWSHEIQNYIASTTGKLKPSEIFTCPTESVELIEQSTYTRNTNYIANPRVMPDDGDPAGTGSSVSRIRISIIPRPASVIVVADGAVDANGACDWGFFNQTGISTISQAQAETSVPDETQADAGAGKRLSWRHDGKIQAVFADGHTEVFSVGRLKYKNLQIAY